jgi:hypothetical protein
MSALALSLRDLSFCTSRGPASMPAGSAWNSWGEGPGPAARPTHPSSPEQAGRMLAVWRRRPWSAVRRPCVAHARAFVRTLRGDGGATGPRTTERGGPGAPRRTTPAAPSGAPPSRSAWPPQPPPPAGLRAPTTGDHRSASREDVARTRDTPSVNSSGRLGPKRSTVSRYSSMAFSSMCATACSVCTLDGTPACLWLGTGLTRPPRERPSRPTRARRTRTR